MVLRRGERGDGHTVRQGDDRGLLTHQALLDHHRLASLSEASLETLPHGGQCLCLCSGHDNPLAGCQTVRLDHDRCAGLPYVCLRGAQISEGAPRRSRDAAVDHERLGERLAPLELCGNPVRSHNPQVPAPKNVDDALTQGHLGPDDRQSHVVTGGEGSQLLMTFHTDLLGLHHAVTARSTVHPFDQRALGEFPHKGVLTAATAEYQRVHADCPFEQRWRTMDDAILSRADDPPSRPGSRGRTHTDHGQPANRQRTTCPSVSRRSGGRI